MDENEQSPISNHVFLCSVGGTKSGGVRIFFNIVEQGKIRPCFVCLQPHQARPPAALQTSANGTRCSLCWRIVRWGRTCCSNMQMTSSRWRLDHCGEKCSGENICSSIQHIKIPKQEVDFYWIQPQWTQLYERKKFGKFQGSAQSPLTPAESVQHVWICLMLPVWIDRWPVFWRAHLKEIQGM